MIDDGHIIFLMRGTKDRSGVSLIINIKIEVAEIAPTLAIGTTS